MIKVKISANSVKIWVGKEHATGRKPMKKARWLERPIEVMKECVLKVNYIGPASNLSMTSILNRD